MKLKVIFSSFQIKDRYGRRKEQRGYTQNDILGMYGTFLYISGRTADVYDSIQRLYTYVGTAHYTWSAISGLCLFQGIQGMERIFRITEPI